MTQSVGAGLEIGNDHSFVEQVEFKAVGTRAASHLVRHVPGPQRIVATTAFQNIIALRGSKQVIPCAS